ncbi:hypothetical protein PK35_gp68 [Geobacillus phage vB_GthS_PK3.5]|nr:hypothetical protein PK35_gp68 [Geobacillus phage vB_GthS_PK3.5]
MPLFALFLHYFLHCFLHFFEGKICYISIRKISSMHIPFPQAPLFLFGGRGRAAF